MLPAGGDVRVDADLHVRVEGHMVTVTADGDHVRVQVSDPAAVFGVLTSTALPVASRSPFTRRSLGYVADTLAGGGLTLVVEGPAGRLATLGSDAGGGRWTRRLLGTTHLSIGSWSTVRPAIGPVARSVLRRLRAAGRRRIYRYRRVRQG